MDQKTLLQLAKKHGTPLVVVDHKVLRENYEQFRKYLPRVQVYYAVDLDRDNWSGPTNIACRLPGLRRVSVLSVVARLLETLADRSYLRSTF
jgi:hypothetical protein